MTELVVGTKKGLFLLEGEPGSGFEITTRAFAGEPVDYAARDPRSGRLLAAMTSPFYGPKIFYTDGDPGEEWTQAEGVALPEGGDQALERIWVSRPARRTDALCRRRSRVSCSRATTAARAGRSTPDCGSSPHARSGSQAAAGCACTRSAHGRGSRTSSRWRCRPPGMWLTEDGGRSWRRGNGGLSPRYLPEEALKDENAGRCVHHVERAPRRPERMFMQFHGGVYRSDDAGESWTDIGGGGLPSDFGFPLMVDPADPDSAYVIPLVADMDRVTPDGRVRVYETRDGGSSWSPRGDGLPAEHAYLTVLRQAFSRAGRGRATGALLRRDLRRHVRLGRRRRHVVDGRDAAAAGVLSARRLDPMAWVARCRVDLPG